MKALQVIESAYRCNIEEQDDPAIWIAHAMKKADADLGVMLRGNAVNYAVSGQDASGLAFGDVFQAHPPRMDVEVNRLIESGVPVYLVKEDADDRGIPASSLLPGIETIGRANLPEVFAGYDQVWHW